MKYIDKSGQGNTLLILTDAESRLIREFLTKASFTSLEATAAHSSFNNGIQRGTERMAAEFKDEQRAKKASDR